jgi:hypothetical protein
VISEDELRAMEARIRYNMGTNAESHVSPSQSTDYRPESMIQQECVKLMQEDGWRTLRTDPVSDKSRGKGFGEVGMADMLFMLPCPIPREFIGANPLFHVLWVEFKAVHGKPSSKQIEWHRNERARGALTWIAGVDFTASVEGFKAHYRDSGLCRREGWGN